MTSEGSNYDGLMEHIEAAFQRYYRQNHTVVETEMMKRDRETGEFSMDTVMIVLLDPTSYSLMKNLIPLLHDPSMQHHLLAALEDTIRRAGEVKEKDDNPQ